MAAVKFTLQVILLLILTGELVLSNMSPIHLRCFYLHTITQNENERGNRESLYAAMDHGANQTQRKCRPFGRGSLCVSTNLQCKPRRSSLAMIKGKKEEDCHGNNTNERENAFSTRVNSEDG